MGRLADCWHPLCCFESQGLPTPPARCVPTAPGWTCAGSCKHAAAARSSPAPRRRPRPPPPLRCWLRAPGPRRGCSRPCGRQRTPAPGNRHRCTLGDRRADRRRGLARCCQGTAGRSPRWRSRPRRGWGRRRSTAGKGGRVGGGGAGGAQCLAVCDVVVRAGKALTSSCSRGQERVMLLCHAVNLQSICSMRSMGALTSSWQKPLNRRPPREQMGTSSGGQASAQRQGGGCAHLSAHSRGPSWPQENSTCNVGRGGGRGGGGNGTAEHRARSQQRHATTQVRQAAAPCAVLGPIQCREAGAGAARAAAAPSQGACAACGACAAHP